MSRKERVAGESVLRYWADSFFLKDLIPLEKRLFDWWISEGFFCAKQIRTEHESPHTH